MTDSTRPNSGDQSSAATPLRDALIERWFDIDTDHREVSDEQILARIEDLVGEGWHAAGLEAERHEKTRRELRSHVERRGPAPRIEVM